MNHKAANAFFSIEISDYVTTIVSQLSLCSFHGETCHFVYAASPNPK